jgi:purine-binding chemotaxis protein CheW
MGVLNHMNLNGDVGGGEIPQIPGQENEETIPFLVFNVAAETFALEVASVREVLRMPKMSWVPGADASVQGVINLRGNIIAVLDLGILVGLDSGDGSDSESRIIVIESGDVMVGLHVDSVSEVAELKPGSLEHTMRTLDESQRNVVVSQTTVKDRIVGVLDIDQVVEVAREKQSQS